MTSSLSSALSAVAIYTEGQHRTLLEPFFAPDRFGLVTATRGYSLFSKLFGISHPQSWLSLLCWHGCSAYIHALELHPSSCMS